MKIKKNVCFFGYSQIFLYTTRKDLSYSWLITTKLIFIYNYTEKKC